MASSQPASYRRSRSRSLSAGPSKTSVNLCAFMGYASVTPWGQRITARSICLLCERAFLGVDHTEIWQLS